MRIPNATYRLQLNRDFGFRQALELVPHLDAIGITHLYLSPIFQARKGSMHGYDITDPSRLNEELGTVEDFEALVNELRGQGMGILLDIVPNHMAASPANPWWMDVLENGSASPYAASFDVEWSPATPAVKEKIYLPILGEPYAEALEQRKLRLWIHQTGLRLSYYDTPFPLDPSTYHDVVSYHLSDLLGKLDASQPLLQELGDLLETMDRLPARTADEWESLEARREEAPRVKEKLWDLYSRFAEFREFLDGNIRVFNGTPGDEASFDLLDALIGKQPYELAFWRVAREKINYRRFFDITDLIGIRAQDPQVFAATHAFALQLCKEGKVSGYRVDHVDGLYDPTQYLVSLQQRAAESCGKSAYIVVEKILNETELLPNSWPVAGTTGYDFLGAANNVFVHPEGLERLQAVYAEFTGLAATFYDVANEQKRNIMRDLFVGEMNALTYHLQAIADRDRHGRDLSPQELRRTLVEITISMPVYRTYVRDTHIGAHDSEFLGRSINDARRRNPQISAACFDFVSRVLLLNVKNGLKEDALRFLMRWQQLTGPIMAKGVEDTSLYVFNRLVSMNEVGGCPEPVSVDGFHAFNTERNARWPATMNADSTHDTKRSGDVRARINVLSEMPDAWAKNARRWSRWNRAQKREVGGALAPDANDEYLTYQTLIGAWPIEWDRLERYLVKAVREAKVHTSWFAPNAEYEAALLDFAKAILEPSSMFMASFEALHTRVSFYGAINALAQTLLKIASPGIPDFYQDTMRWSFRLVDPDNRLPPDPSRTPAPCHFDPELLENWQDGRIKAWVISAALRFRKDNPELFGTGEYLPLSTSGRGSDHSIAFARRYGNSYAIAIAPRFTSTFSALEKHPLGRRIWRDSYVAIPPEAPDTWRNVLTDETVHSATADGSTVIYISDALKSCPVALLSSETTI